MESIVGLSGRQNSTVVEDVSEDAAPFCRQVNYARWGVAIMNMIRIMAMGGFLLLLIAFMNIQDSSAALWGIIGLVVFTITIQAALFILAKGFRLRLEDGLSAWRTRAIQTCYPASAYRCGEGVARAHLEASGAPLGSYDSFVSRDLLTWGDRECSHVRTTRTESIEETETDEDGHMRTVTRHHTVVVFDGFLFRAPFPSLDRGWVVITGRRAPVPRTLSPVSHGNPRLSGTFHVWSSDPFLAHKLLAPAYSNRVVAMLNLFGAHDVFLSFRDGSVYLLVRGWRLDYGLLPFYRPWVTPAMLNRMGLRSLHSAGRAYAIAEALLESGRHTENGTKQ